MWLQHVRHSRDQFTEDSKGPPRPGAGQEAQHGVTASLHRLSVLQQAQHPGEGGGAGCTAVSRQPLNLKTVEMADFTLWPFIPTGRQKLCLVSLRMLKIHAGFICFQGKNQASAAVTGIQRSRKLLLADDGKKGQMEPRVFRILCSPDLGLVPTGLS